MKEPKVALIHDVLVQYGGAEKTLEAITEIFPDAPIYTGIYKPEKFTDIIRNKNIICPNNPFIRSAPKYFTPIMPLIFEGFDLRKYDLIISDSSCYSKGVLTNTQQLHISYIHTPPRFLYKYSVESTKRNKWYFKPFVTVIDTFLRIWDFNAAQRPNFLLANSEEVKKRIKKFYKRDAQVIYPPVELENTATATKGDYYLTIGRLVAYKNFDVLIEAFNRLGWPLVIIGSGQEEGALRSIAKSNIRFEGHATDERKKELLAGCLGLINPVVDEDLGIVPIEAMAYGKPVMAHKSGGHLETIEDGVSGLLYPSNTPEDLMNYLDAFNKAIQSNKFDPEEIKKRVQKFSKERFQREFRNYVMEKWNSFSQQK